MTPDERQDFARALLLAVVAFAVLVGAYGRCATWDVTVPPSHARCP